MHTGEEIRVFAEALNGMDYYLENPDEINSMVDIYLNAKTSLHAVSLISHYYYQKEQELLANPIYNVLSEMKMVTSEHGFDERPFPHVQDIIQKVWMIEDNRNGKPKKKHFVNQALEQKYHIHEDDIKAVDENNMIKHPHLQSILPKDLKL